jgi:hypothetical protein
LAAVGESPTLFTNYLICETLQGDRMCNCIKKMNEHLKKYNTILEEVSMVNFTTGKVRQSLQITTAKLERKSGKKKVVLPTFCPFCGIRSAPATETTAEVTD